MRNNVFKVLNLLLTEIVSKMGIERYSHNKLAS